MPLYLNITLASNKNFNAATSVTQGGEPSGSSNLYPNTDQVGEGKADVSATTQFISDKNVVSATTMLPTQINSLVYNSSMDLASQDIKTFLAKPAILLSGSFTTTDTISTFSDINNPFDNFVQSANILKPKLEGFLGFRATTVYKLVVNANRFQQGRYNMCYVHLGGADGTSKTNNWANDHIATLVQRTTLPHVELDLCCDTEAILRIPYNSAMNFYPLQNFSNTGIDNGAWGILNIYPYVPLAAATGNLTAGFVLYSWFEDVELIGSVVPQSGRVSMSKKSRKNETEVEQDSVNIGPVSGALIKVRDASSLLAQVPLLSSYATSVSWISDILASSAKVFGWSKPVILSPSTRVTQNYLPYVASTDGPDTSFPLSLTTENKVGMANGFSGTDVDEMSFSYLATIPVWDSTVTWSKTDASGTSLYSAVASPGASVYTTIVNSTTFKHFSPMQFIAEHFNYWRGSMVFKLKFVKTEFHSGRLAICYIPKNTSINNLSVTLSNSVYLQRHIIDIRETNEFTFVVPYVADAPYRNTGSGSDSASAYFYIFVVDPLVAPDTVSSSVSIIVERCGGNDLEFAVPSITTLNYYQGITPQSGTVDAPNVCSNANTTIGNSSICDDGGLNSLHCIGERITSFRTLLKKPNVLLPSAGVTLANYLNILPFSITSGTVVLAVNTAPPVLNDLYSRLASCYVYSRGGIRLKYLDNMAVTTTTPIAVALDVRQGSAPLRAAGLQWSATNAAGTANSTDQNGMPVVYYRAGYSGEVQVPQYHKYHSRVNSECVANSITGYSNNSLSLAPKISVSRYSVPLSTTAGTSVLRSVADDGNFGCFLSIPPMFDVTSTVF